MTTDEQNSELSRALHRLESLNTLADAAETVAACWSVLRTTQGRLGALGLVAALNRLEDAVFGAPNPEVLAQALLDAIHETPELANRNLQPESH